jgi:hypothetical protein
MLRVLLVTAAMTLLAQPALAQQRSAYKYVDEHGNVVYSQTPPVEGKEARKVDISPAHRGREAYAPAVPMPREPDYRTRWSSGSGPDPRAAQQQREEAEKKRLADLQAECNRNRGTDCANPETLRYMESTAIPRRRY